MSDGYFVHFFAPANIDPLPKDVIFVIDKSGSMWGNKIVQLQQAMTKILTDMYTTDRFTVLAFDNNMRWWKTNLEPATPENIESAKTYVGRVTASGGRSATCEKNNVFVKQA